VWSKGYSVAGWVNRLTIQVEDLENLGFWIWGQKGIFLPGKS